MSNKFKTGYPCIKPKTLADLSFTMTFSFVQKILLLKRLNVIFKEGCE